MTSIGGVSEPVLRGAVFVGVLAVLLIAERVWPKRRLAAPLVARWRTNVALVLLDTGLIRMLAALLPAFAAAGVAAFATERGIGLFNLTDWPPLAEIGLAMIALDFAIWAQHLVYHKVALFWRFHSVHHADRDLDATTALRFHPVEIVLSAAYKSLLALALGAPVIAVVAFEITLNACAMFNHANLALPGWLDRMLRTILVTPDMHRVHHSVHAHEHNTNFGFCLSLWDRLFGVYRAQPEAGHDGMTLGLAPHQDAAPTRLGWSLLAPFRGW